MAGIETMPSATLDSIFHLPNVHRRHHDAPLLKEREQYLQYLLDRGTGNERVRSVASMLLNITRLMRLDCLHAVGLSDVLEAAKRWSLDTGAHYKKRNGKITEHFFTFTALSWLRFHHMLITPPKAAPPYGEVFTQFITYITETKGLSPATIHGHSSKVLLFLKWVAERHTQFSEISLVDVDDYHSNKKIGGCKPRTIVAECQSFRTFFRFTEMQGWTQSPIAIGIKSPSVSRYDTGLRGPSWRKVRRLLADKYSSKPADLRARAMLFLCSIYAMRSSEVANLTLDDFDWFNETLTVRHSKRGRVQQYPLQFEVGEAILRYLREGRPRCTCRHLFVSLNAPYRPIPSKDVGWIVTERMKRANIDTKPLGPHSLRHSCATQLLRNGSSLKDIADFLGHRSTASVCIYAKFDRRLLRKVSQFSLAAVR
jgi:integrase/recombinase XerD